MQIEIHQISFMYPNGHQALHQLDLTIEAGEWVLLAGTNGSGKSTVCRLLNGLIPHIHPGTLTGQVFIAGHNTHTVGPQTLFRDVGWLGQRLDVFCFNATVAHELAWNLQCAGISRNIIKQRCTEVAKAWELQHLLNRAPQTLSSGERLRVALAAVLSTQPRILVLDEPTATLDDLGQHILLAALEKIHRNGTTIIVADHNVALFVAHATRMLVLEQGQLIADDQPHVLINDQRFAWAYKPSSPSNQLQPGKRVFQAEHLGYTINSTCIFHNLSFEVHQRETLLIQGRNGTGKSTLLKIMAGVHKPSKGSYKQQGRTVLAVQQPEHMLFAPTVEAELKAGPRTLQQQNSAWLKQLITRFELEPLLHRVPHTLSGGEQRRVALAALLALQPTILLLDEPTSHLDWHWRWQIQSILYSYLQNDLALMIATHDQQWTFPTRLLHLSKQQQEFSYAF